MNIYTKTGDKGNTSLIGGIRVSKSDQRIEAIGSLDELNAHIGMLRDMDVNINRSPILIEVQKRLFDIGAILATTDTKKSAKTPKIDASDVLMLEKVIDEMSAVLAPLRYFVLPGGHMAISFGHIARSICRRAERQVVGLHKLYPLSEVVIQYLNRLSDFLFVLCRKMHQELSIEETPWIPNNK